MCWSSHWLWKTDLPSKLHYRTNSFRILVIISWLVIKNVTLIKIEIEQYLGIKERKKNRITRLGHQHSNPEGRYVHACNRSSSRFYSDSMHLSEKTYNINCNVKGVRQNQPPRNILVPCMLNQFINSFASFVRTEKISYPCILFFLYYCFLKYFLF
jgi:hypothetical protein